MAARIAPRRSRAGGASRRRAARRGSLVYLASSPRSWCRCAAIEIIPEFLDRRAGAGRGPAGAHVADRPRALLPGGVHARADGDAAHRDARHVARARRWRCRWRCWPRATSCRVAAAQLRCAQLILVSSRSVNSLVWALIFVAVFGPGAAGRHASPSPSARSASSASCFGEALEEAQPRPDRGADARPARPGRRCMTQGLLAAGAAGVLVRSRCSAGTSTCANRRCSAWSAPAASAWRSTTRINLFQWDRVATDPGGDLRRRDHRRGRRHADPQAVML